MLIALTSTVLSAGMHAALAADARQSHSGHQTRRTRGSHCQLRDMLDTVPQTVQQMSGQMRGQIGGHRAVEEGHRVQKDATQL